MSTFRLESRGIGSLIRDMEGYVAELNSVVAKEGTDNTREVVREARGNHEFQTRSGQLEASIQDDYRKEGNTHIFEIFLNDSLTTASNGNSYGVFQHEGTYLGYKQSPIAPLYKNSTPKTGFGIKADPFLWKAYESKWNLPSRLERALEKLRRKYQRR